MTTQQLHPDTAATVRRLHDRAKAEGLTLVAFWQDHFYTRNGRFGYPVCIQLHNDNQVETSRIVHWSSNKAYCDDMVAAIDELIGELESEVAK